MDKKIFRSKSIDRISSPEQLNDYVRVSNPGVWMALIAIIVLLVGVCAWGIFGRMESTVQTAITVKDGKARCCITEENIENIDIGQSVKIKGGEYMVKGISHYPILVSDDMDAYVLYIGALTEGEWVYEVTIDTDLPDGIYEGEIVVESISPMSFLLY